MGEKSNWGAKGLAEEKLKNQRLSVSTEQIFEGIVLIKDDPSRLVFYLKEKDLEIEVTDAELFEQVEIGQKVEVVGRSYDHLDQDAEHTKDQAFFRNGWAYSRGIPHIDEPFKPVNDPNLHKSLVIEIPYDNITKRNDLLARVQKQLSKIEFKIGIKEEGRTIPFLKLFPKTDGDLQELAEKLCKELGEDAVRCYNRIFTPGPKELIYSHIYLLPAVLLCNNEGMTLKEWQGEIDPDNIIKTYRKCVSGKKIF